MIIKREALTVYVSISREGEKIQIGIETNQPDSMIRTYMLDKEEAKAISDEIELALSSGNDPTCAHCGHELYRELPFQDSPMICPVCTVENGGRCKACGATLQKGPKRLHCPVQLNYLIGRSPDSPLSIVQDRACSKCSEDLMQYTDDAGDHMLCTSCTDFKRIRGQYE